MKYFHKDVLTSRIYYFLLLEWAYQVTVFNGYRGLRTLTLPRAASSFLAVADIPSFASREKG